MNKYIQLEERYCAHHYAPLQVALARGEGVYVWDSEGNRYLDVMSAYSAVSLGHCHPRIVRAISDQIRQLGVVSRAYYNNRLGDFLKLACTLTGYDVALPMNTGAEAVETALKAARKWACTVKSVADGRAEIIACRGNFHGRTIAIVGMSSEAQYRAGFGPFPDGFRLIPFADIEALKRAINANTAAFLVEPIQGEGGIVLPPDGYLAACARICREHNVLLICDEIQTGLGRTGQMLACQHEGVIPDGVTLGKALGGGFLPVSLFLARREVMDVFTPGDHGSTFGGNPLSAVVGEEALRVLVDEGLVERSARLGRYLLDQLQGLEHPLVREIRGRGLFIGMELDTGRVSARRLCELLLQQGVLSKETHETVIRFAPPLVISAEQIDWLITRVKRALDMAQRSPG